MGKPMILTTGEYSDYSIRAVVEWTGKGTPQDAVQAFRDLPRPPEEADDGEWYDDLGDRFVTFLIEKEYARRIEHDEWRFGEYGRFTGEMPS